MFKLLLCTLAMAYVSAAPIPDSIDANHTVVGVAARNPDLSNLVIAIEAAGLEKTLQGAGKFTVFAPTNEAFAKLPTKDLARLLAPEGEGEVKELQRVLTYHVVSGTIFSEDFVDNSAITTLEGDTVLAHVMTTGVPNPGGAGALEQIKVNDATVITVDVPASNGVIHIIDTVLNPSKPKPATICGIVNDDSNYPEASTIAAAIKATSFNTLCERGPYTLFAPSNKAFARLPAGTLAHLLEPANEKELSDILAYHVSPGYLFSGTLVNGSYPTLSVGPLSVVKVTIAADGSSVQINNAFVTTADIAASNGVVHIIDTVLTPPKAPAPAPASTTICDIVNDNGRYSEVSTIAAALKAASFNFLCGGGGPYTLFAPSNKAFARLPAGTLAHLLEPANVQELGGLLGYHVALGANFASVTAHNAWEQRTGQHALYLIDGGDLTTTYRRSQPTGVPAIIYSTVKVTIAGSSVQINNAFVTTADIAASNGVVHIIDTVLTVPKA